MNRYPELEQRYEEFVRNYGVGSSYVLSVAVSVDDALKDYELLMQGIEAQIKGTPLPGGYREQSFVDIKKTLQLIQQEIEGLRRLKERIVREQRER